MTCHCCAFSECRSTLNWEMTAPYPSPQRWAACRMPIGQCLQAKHGAHVAQLMMDLSGGCSLDAIGAIGVARCLTFGGAKNRILWSPDLPPQLVGQFVLLIDCIAPSKADVYLAGLVCTTLTCLSSTHMHTERVQGPVHEVQIHHDKSFL